jgi:hypothetical protein
MVSPLARAAGTISINPAAARCGRNLAPREGPRHCCRLRSVTTTDQASRTRSPAFSLTPLSRTTSGPPRPGEQSRSMKSSVTGKFWRAYHSLPAEIRAEALPNEHHSSDSLVIFRYRRLRNSSTDIPASLTIPPIVSAFTGL